ncbi:YlbF family regulator [Cytobacillus sp. Hm23]
MLATLETVEIIDGAEELSKMILDSEVFENYNICLNKLKKNEDAQSLIDKFVNIKEQYEDVQRFGKYHPDYKKISREVREIKREVDLNEIISEFKKAENSIQVLLDEISIIIGKTVSDSIKVPTGNPFFDAASSCGGGCGVGGSCGCH